MNLFATVSLVCQDIIPSNQVTLLARRALATNSPPDFGPYPSCGAVHPWVESCTHVPLPRFVTVFKWAFPIYGALHFVPMILFKRHAFFKDPLHKLGRAGWATIRSSAFLATFIATFQSMYLHRPFVPACHFTSLCSVGLFQALPLQDVILPNFSQAPTKIYRLLCVKVFLWTRWIVWCTFTLCRGKAQARGARDVCFAEGHGKCLVDGKRQGLGFPNWPIWGDDCKCPISCWMVVLTCASSLQSE
jgi:hypothetical protein